MSICQRPFIAYKMLSPAFSHLIFTAGLGRRYYHYLHFTGEERRLSHLPAGAEQVTYLCGVAVMGFHRIPEGLS